MRAASALPAMADREPDIDAVVRHEDELAEAEGRRVETGRLRLRKLLEPVEVDEEVERDVEHVDLERVAVGDGDSGRVEELPDGSLSIPVYEEQVVVTKRVVLKERVIVRKGVVEERQRVRTTLRRERVEVDADPPEAGGREPR